MATGFAALGAVDDELVVAARGAVDPDEDVVDAAGAAGAAVWLPPEQPDRSSVSAAAGAIAVRTCIRGYVFMSCSLG